MNILNRILFVSLLSVVISCGHKQKQATDPRPPIKVTVQKITAKHQHEILDYPGNIEADNTASLGFTGLNDLEGHQVPQGQLLAGMKTEDYASALQESIADKSIVPASVIDEGKGIVEEKREDDNKIFEKVEIEASFKGGESAWRKYLEKNLKPGVAVDNGAPDGLYTVYVQFVVSKDGSISDVRALTSRGYGMEAEAMRVIKKGPAWTPAIQNGRSVNAYRRQPIIFQVEAE